MLAICHKCGKDFKRSPSQLKRSEHHFCSRSCSVSFNNIGLQRNPRRPKKERRKILKTEEIKKLTIMDISQKISVLGKHPSWLSGYIRIYNRSWNQDLSKKACQKCGYINHVELSHIKAISSFPKTATLGEVNDPGNILILCPNHHWEYDHGLITLSDILDKNW